MPQPLHHLHHVLGHLALGVGSVVRGRLGLVRAAVAAQIGAHDSEALRQPRRHRVPHGVRLRVAVQQQQRRPRPAAPQPDRPGARRHMLQRKSRKDHQAPFPAPRRMRRLPVAGDVDAAAQPHAALGLHVIEKPRQRRRPSRAADEPAVEADRHHLRRTGAPLLVEQVEAVLEVGEELVARVEPLRGGKAHVVGIERVGHDQVRPARTLDPVGQIVGIGVGGVEEAALLHDDARRVRGAAALVEAERTLAGDARCGCGSPRGCGRARRPPRSPCTRST